MSNAEDIIDELDPDKVKCPFCEKYFLIDTMNVIKPWIPDLIEYCCKDCMVADSNARFLDG